MKTFKANPNRYENTAIAAYQQMIRERIEQGWHPSLLTFTFNPMPDNRALPPEAIGKSLAQFYSLCLTRLIHHPHRGPITNLPLMVGMPDLPLFKHRKISVVATINDGLHAHAVFLKPIRTRNGRTLASTLEENGNLFKDACHLMSIHCADIKETPGKAVAYVLKSLDLKRFPGDDIWIFPKSRSERTKASRRVSRHD
ncbi:MAG: hypothetical protein P0Y65_00340 [Candidatus Devosia phytovorans]|uniref:Uncharacterized protein n=1 Tax=Candidatus Devosia phytovorans TaxID=3121372 RepID=A0AAJ5VWK5_9HYPH|nr:hypothetical protein [Devosia sp.]WEK04743.1 MAG: hypothetical protein P0Y65_00340 [Devosia sp.]